MSDSKPDLHPVSLIYSLLLGLLATFIANLVPEPFNWIAILVVIVALFAATTTYLSKLPGKQHIALVRNVRFLVSMFVLGALIASVTAIIPTVILNGIYLPQWISDAMGAPPVPQKFSINELVYAIVITLFATAAYWVSRTLMKPLSFILAAMAGAVIIDSTFTRSFLDSDDVENFPIDPVLTYVTWAALSLGFVLLNALMPILMTELRGFFTRSKQPASEDEPVTDSSPLG